MALDIGKLIEKKMMPKCPLCDQYIKVGDEISIVTSGGVGGLAHGCCADDALEDIECMTTMRFKIDE